MVYMAIETLVKNLNGETVPEKIDSPIKLITQWKRLVPPLYLKRVPRTVGR